MVDALIIDRDLQSKKPELLGYLRQRSSEYMAEISVQYGQTQFKQRAAEINRALSRERDLLIGMIRQESARTGWPIKDIIATKLLVMHCVNVVMIENRNQQWPYEYMTFSRRIGELWEPFCAICFDPPAKSDVRLFIPPLFQDVKDRLAQEVRDFVARLKITTDEKASLLHYYDQVWQLITSGEIKLELDLHLEIGGTRHVVDFKSGFGSNEKGNTNRLLLVASVYANIEPENYRCVLLVRSAEDENNNYLQTLKNSDIWEVYCGVDAYSEIYALSGFDLGAWVQNNVSWDADLNSDTIHHLEQNDLMKYLAW